jgi:hypothetical protein
MRLVFPIEVGYGLICLLSEIGSRVPLHLLGVLRFHCLVNYPGKRIRAVVPLEPFVDGLTRASASYTVAWHAGNQHLHYSSSR